MMFSIIRSTATYSAASSCHMLTSGTLHNIVRSLSSGHALWLALDGIVERHVGRIVEHKFLQQNIRKELIIMAMIVLLLLHL